MNKNYLCESKADEAKTKIISYLISEGYGTYASRLKAYKFIIADRYHGQYIPVAAMFPDVAEIVVNPGMFDANSVLGNEDKIMGQLSVVIRHELLHFLLVHSKRFINHLKKIDPNWEKASRLMSINEIANYAMDYDISNVGYDDDDKERVRLMTINGRCVGGLIAEDDHPEWGVKTMEEMYDILKAEHDKAMAAKPLSTAPKTTVHIKEASHSPEYTNTYNNLMNILNSSNFSDGDLAAMLSDAISGNTLINPITGEVLISEGE